MKRAVAAVADSKDGPDPFTNRWSRMVCNTCLRTLLRGEAGYRLPLGDPVNRPTGPVWCGACGWHLSVRRQADHEGRDIP